MTEFKNLQYHVMPQDQGQIVLRSYAVDSEYLYRHTIDQSDKTESWERALLDADDETEFQPQNNQLPEHEEWESFGGRYFITDGHASENIEATSMDEAEEWAIEKWQDGSWDSKILIQLDIEEFGFGEEVIDHRTIEIECGEDPEAPDCEDGHEHDWCSPYEVVGGMSENPGVFSKGGTTMVFVEVCSHCGCKKIETHYGAQRNPHQCDQIEYDTEDENAIEWANKAKEAN